MTIALAFVVGMLVVAVAGLAWVVRETRTDLRAAKSLLRSFHDEAKAGDAALVSLKASHESLVRSLRNQRGIVDGG